MKAKGTAVKSLKDYIIEEHGTEGLQRWLEALAPASRAIHQGTILTNAWYPFEDGLLGPMKAMDRMFYQGRAEGAWRQGRYTAEKNLHGIYKVFVKVANPQFLIRNTASLWHTYYDGSQAEVSDIGPGRAVLTLTGIETASLDYDHSVGGWVERALEICGCQRITVAISNPAPGTTRYEVGWQY